MKVLLMEPEKEVNMIYQPPVNEELLIKDLELNTLFNYMSRRDPFIHNVVKQTILSKDTSLQTIKYRQDILKDCLKNFDLIKVIYELSVTATQNRKNYMIKYNSMNPTGTLNESVNLLKIFFGLLNRLKKIVNENKDKFLSKGFNRFINMILEELNDDYLIEIRETLNNLRFKNGVLIRANLGFGNKGINYTLIKKPENNDKEPWVKRVFNFNSKSYSYDLGMHSGHIYHQDSESLLELQEKVTPIIANATADSANHIEMFFKHLEFQLAFYIGCINLYETLMKMNADITFPESKDFGKYHHEFTGLYDISLALTKKTKVVGNDLNINDKSFILITGANQGGKSTFLRSIGISQLMMQCGMFVPAKSYSANLQRMIFTHFKREEDLKMKKGKLDEELNRTNDIIDHLTQDSLILFNESFTSTNEREGSEIAKQVIDALVNKPIKIFFVSHMFTFASHYFENRNNKMQFLRAARQADGSRTFKLIEGEPFRTSYAKDLYLSLFN